MEELEKRTAEDFIRENIEKANIILDLVLNNVSERKKVSAEMVKSVSSLIDTITTAANNLISAEAEEIGLQIRQDMLKLKERELDLKSLNSGPGQGKTNIFVGSFTDLIKQINSQPSGMIE